MKKRDEFVFKIHGDPSRWHVTVCYALLRSVKVYCDSHVLPRSPKIWCPIVTSVAKFLTVKHFATLVTINTIHSRPLAITTIPVYVLSRLPRFFPIVVIVAIVAQCKPSISQYCLRQCIGAERTTKQFLKQRWLSLLTHICVT